MPCDVPSAQRLDLLGGRGPWRDEAALHGEKPRITHRRSMRRLRITFRELRGIDLAKNGKRGEF
jgi:hypothetical protein